MNGFTVTGRLVDILNNKIYEADVKVEAGKIISITQNPSKRGTVENNNSDKLLPYLLPGFVDAHVHIESSMLIPAQFARLAVVHGTVATVSDPHEIANVCGVAGVEYMIDNGNTVPFKFAFGAPGCVPATVFETAGAAINSKDIEALLNRSDINYLTEMMNFPGVLAGDEEVLKKIEAAKKKGKPIDGHAPGLRGKDAEKYISAGISTDHECFTAEEAAEKLSYGMKILIREGSAAKNFNALISLLNNHSDSMMFCSDDKHPDALVDGHINDLCRRAVASGVNVFKVLKAACINPVLHYNLAVGLLREGDAADFIVVKDLTNFDVLQTYIDGVLVAENGVTKTEVATNPKDAKKPINVFNCTKKIFKDFAVFAKGNINTIQVIEALDGQLITNKLTLQPTILNGQIVSDVEKDVLKIVVVNRYHPAPIAKAFIKNFGLKRGAIASSVAHDSHNIVAVGVDDESLCKAVNLIIEQKGGISVCNGIKTNALADGELDNDLLLPLPVGGLMSANDGYKVAEQYKALDAAAKALGSPLSAPFMTLSFMALLVIPHLKISDKGLFDGDLFAFADEESSS